MAHFTGFHSVWIGAMSSRLRLLTALFVTLAAASWLAGCSFEPGSRTQLAGQECFGDGDCVDGLVCVQRRCQYRAFDHADAGGDVDAADVIDDATDVPSDVPPDVPPLMDVAVDGSQRCTPGRRRCAGDAVVEICADDGSRYFRRECEQGLVCQNGDCMPTNTCRDDDGDGYGRGCELGADCNDNNPDIHPDRNEVCSTPVDDNCDGQVNETCTECCPGGCGADQFCSNCQCVPVDPSVCRYQDQPCSNEGPSNGFYCASIEQNGELRCIGLCDSGADNPDATCPAAGTVCAFGTGDPSTNQALCLNGCTISQGCGTPGYGCLPIDGSQREGICVPTNPANKLGDSCNADQFMDCEEGAFCADLNNGGRCVQACRPFTNAHIAATDCPQGSHCVAVAENIGMCQTDIPNVQEGDRCGRDQVFRTCGQDAVACYPSGGRGTRCMRICRIAEGDADCNSGQSCYQYDQNSNVGVCVDGGFVGGGN